MSTPKTAPDFGEHWYAIGNHLYDRFGHQLAIFNYGSHAERAAICVIACSGLSDPAAEIQALRDALQEIANGKGGAYNAANIARNALQSLA